MLVEERRQKVLDLLTDKGLSLIFENNNDSKEIKIPTSVSGLTTDISVSYFSLGDWKSVIWQAYEFGRTGALWRRILGLVDHH